MPRNPSLGCSLAHLKGLFKELNENEYESVLITLPYSCVFYDSLNWCRQCSKCRQISVEFSDSDTLLNYTGIVKTSSTWGQEFVCVGVGEVLLVKDWMPAEGTRASVYLQTCPIFLVGRRCSQGACPEAASPKFIPQPQGPPAAYWPAPLRMEVLI